MRILSEERIEILSFRLAVEGVELVAPDGVIESRPEAVLARFARRKNQNWELSALEFERGNYIRLAWPCPVPEAVQRWVDEKLVDLRGGWSVKS